MERKEAQEVVVGCLYISYLTELACHLVDDLYFTTVAILSRCAFSLLSYRFLAVVLFSSLS